MFGTCNGRIVEFVRKQLDKNLDMQIFFRVDGGIVRRARARFDSRVRGWYFMIDNKHRMYVADFRRCNVAMAH